MSVTAASAPDIFHVKTKHHAYPIVIGAGVLAQPEAYLFPFLEGRRCFIVTDGNVGSLYLKPFEEMLRQGGYRAVSVVVRPGEMSKSLATVERILHACLEAKAEREDTVIALGGGVVGDIAGFAASVLLRGVPFVQIPTTLLAQVDSSVGGKTGVNSPHGKNLIGTFYQPKCVIIDTDSLKTLPVREIRSGFAEVVKYGVIRDAMFFRELEKHGPSIACETPDPVFLREAIRTSCEIKARIVSADERETGVRALLNFGHTFGHAYESACAYDGRLLHGEAVGFGMVMAADLGRRLGVSKYVDIKSRIEALLASCGMHTSPAAYIPAASPEAILGYMRGDKKVKAGAMRFILPEEIGRASVKTVEDEEMIRSVIASYH